MSGIIAGVIFNSQIKKVIGIFQPSAAVSTENSQTESFSDGKQQQTGTVNNIQESEDTNAQLAEYVSENTAEQNILNSSQDNSTAENVYEDERETIPFESYGNKIMTREYIETAAISSTNSAAGWFVGAKYLMTAPEIRSEYGEFDLYFSHAQKEGESGFLYYHTKDWYHYITSTGIHFTVYMEKDLLFPFGEFTELEITGYEVNPDCICDTAH